MERNKIIDTIQHLLNMTPERGCTEAEAATAMQMAQNLLIKHNLDMASISTDDTGNQDESQLIDEPIDFDTYQPWRWSLVAAVAHSNFCKTIRSSGVIRILGRKANVRAVVAMYNWLEPQVIRLASKSGYVRGEKTSYILGVISTLRGKLAESMAKAEQQAETRALVLNVQSEIDNWYRRQYPHVHSARSSTIHAGAYGHGQADGGKVSIYGSNKQMSGGILRLT